MQESECWREWPRSVYSAKQIEACSRNAKVIPLGKTIFAFHLYEFYSSEQSVHRREADETGDDALHLCCILELHPPFLEAELAG